MKFQISVWGVLRRWWWFVLAGTVIAAGISYYLTSKQPLIYVAKATVSVGQSIRDPDINPQMLALSRTLAYTYADLARRRLITEAVIEARNLNVSPDELRERIQVNVIPDAQLLEIFVYDTDPLQAQATAEEVGRQLVDEQNPLADSQEYQEWVAARNAAQEQVNEIQGQIDALRAEIPTLSSAAEYEEARNRLTQLETLLVDYQDIAVRYATLTANNPANAVWWVEHAVANPYPVAPNKTLNILLGAALGLLVTGGAVVFLEFFDDTVRWRDKGVDEVEGLPVLGVLGSPSRRDPVVTRYRPRSQQAEAVRQLRARIALTRSPHSLRVVLITSPRAKDGKSTTAANLGVASALGGRRTLLIDADMRNPSLNELFDIPNVLGLADLLTAEREDRDRLLDKAIRETSTPNLFVLTAGLTLRDSASLLGSASTGDLFVTLRNRFDYVVVDTPPLLVVPDAAILAPLVEGVVFILRVGRVTRRMVRKMKELLLAAGNVSILGVALTGAPSRVEGKSSTYYRYRSAPATEEFPGLGGRIYKALKFLHRLPVGYTWKLKDGTILVPIAQVARRLGVRTSTAVKWCQGGRLKGARKLFRWWVSEQELHDFVKRELGEEAAAGESAAAGAFSPEDAAALEAADGKAPQKVLPFTEIDEAELERTEVASSEAEP
ncbi:MAG: hypothetical protein Kow00120_17040 [Anaerolineae bacterium]